MNVYTICYIFNNYLRSINQRNSGLALYLIAIILHNPRGGKGKAKGERSLAIHLTPRAGEDFIEGVGDGGALLLQVAYFFA